jgi:hypothetical protein
MGMEVVKSTIHVCWYSSASTSSIQRLHRLHTVFTDSSSGDCRSARLYPCSELPALGLAALAPAASPTFLCVCLLIPALTCLHAAAVSICLCQCAAAAIPPVPSSPAKQPAPAPSARPLRQLGSYHSHCTVSWLMPLTTNNNTMRLMRLSRKLRPCTCIARYALLYQNTTTSRCK